jgi:hypothetical protein
MYNYELVINFSTASVCKGLTFKSKHKSVSELTTYLYQYCEDNNNIIKDKDFDCLFVVKSIKNRNNKHMFSIYDKDRDISFSLMKEIERL